MIMFENVFIAEKLLYNSGMIRAKKKLFYYLIVPKKKLQNVSTCVNKSGDMILF